MILLPGIKVKIESFHCGGPGGRKSVIITWGDENYYMIAYDAEAGKIKHYRVDKMKGILILNKRREGREEFKDFNLAGYARMNFGMFGGEKTKVKLEFDNAMVGVMIDRFGKDITIRPAKKKAGQR